MGLLEDIFGVVTADIMMYFLGPAIIFLGLCIFILVSGLLGIIIIIIGIGVFIKIRKRTS